MNWRKRYPVRLYMCKPVRALPALCIAGLLAVALLTRVKAARGR